MMRIAEILQANETKRRETLLRLQLSLGPGATAENARESIGTWLQQRFGRPINLTQNDKYRQTTTRFLNATVESAVADNVFAVSYYHDDPSEKRFWLTHVGIDLRTEAMLSVELISESPREIITVPPRYSPEILKPISAACGLIDVLALTTDQTITNGQELVSLILNPKRVLPVLVLTGTQRTHATLYAKRLFGTCHIATPSEDQTWQLSQLGHQWSVYGGAIRLFRPRFSVTDDTKRHPRWTEAIIDTITRRGSTFSEIVVSHVFDQVTAAATGRDLVSIERLAGEKLERTMLRRINRKHARPSPTPESPQEASSSDEALHLESACNIEPKKTHVDDLQPESVLTQADDETESESALAQYKQIVEDRNRTIAGLTQDIAVQTQRANETETMYFELEANYLAVSANANVHSLLKTLSTGNAGIVSHIEEIIKKYSELDHRLTAATKENETLKEELHRLRSKTAWIEQRSIPIKESSWPEDSSTPDYDDAEGFLEEVHRRFDDRLTIHPRALGTWKDGQFEDLSLVYEALGLLANEYRDMRLRKPGDESARIAYQRRLEQLGLREGNPISDGEIGNYRNQYEVVHDKKTRRIDTHLRAPRSGSATDPRRVLAIYGFWNESTATFVVCALPGHLANRLSP